MERFELEAGDQPGSFKLVGELDMANVERVQSQLQDELEQSGRLILDGSALAFIDSQGLRMLIRLGEQARKRGETIRLVRCPRHVRRVFDIAVPEGIPGVELEADS